MQLQQERLAPVLADDVLVFDIDAERAADEVVVDVHQRDLGADDAVVGTRRAVFREPKFSNLVEERQVEVGLVFRKGMPYAGGVAPCEAAAVGKLDQRPLRLHVFAQVEVEVDLVEGALVHRFFGERDRLLQLRDEGEVGPFDASATRLESALGALPAVLLQRREAVREQVELVLAVHLRHDVQESAAVVTRSGQRVEAVEQAHAMPVGPSVLRGPGSDLQPSGSSAWCAFRVGGSLPTFNRVCRGRRRLSQPVHHEHRTQKGDRDESEDRTHKEVSSRKGSSGRMKGT